MHREQQQQREICAGITLGRRWLRIALPHCLVACTSPPAAAPCHPPRAPPPTALALCVARPAADPPGGVSLAAGAAPPERRRRRRRRRRASAPCGAAHSPPIAAGTDAATPSAPSPFAPPVSSTRLRASESCVPRSRRPPSSLPVPASASASASASAAAAAAASAADGCIARIDQLIHARLHAVDVGGRREVERQRVRLRREDVTPVRVDVIVGVEEEVEVL